MRNPKPTQPGLLKFTSGSWRSGFISSPWRGDLLKSFLFALAFAHGIEFDFEDFVETDGFDFDDLASFRGTFFGADFHLEFYRLVDAYVVAHGSLLQLSTEASEGKDKIFLNNGILQNLGWPSNTMKPYGITMMKTKRTKEGF